MNTLLQAAKILSVPPIFDSSLAGTLLRTARVSALDAMGDADLGQYAVRQLGRVGVIAPFSSWWRFPEPVRHDFLRSFQRDHLEIYQSVAAATVHAMSNGSSELMIRALGQRGTKLTAAVLELATGGKAEERAFGTLVDELGTSASSGRMGDADAASRLMHDIPASADRERQHRFVSGLAAWQDGRKKEAAEDFAFVWRAGIEDKAYGIAAHLLAAFEQGRRNPESAYQFALAAVRVLSMLGDTRGQVLALTTLGRIERDIVDAGSELATGLDPVQTLERAVEIAHELSPRLAGISIGYLAGVLQHLRRWDDALELAEEAQALIPADDEAQLPVLTALGSLYRSTGQFEKSRDALRRGIEIAESVDDQLQVAILLNVLAGSERYVGLLKEAVQDAKRSVELGEKLGNRHHLSQAYNTLARVLLDAALTPHDLAIALDAAQKSQRLLKEMGDRRGLKFIENTIGQIEQKLMESG